MRLKRLQLRNYGCFGSLDIEFATEPGCITLITAPNGAGKSVLRRAFHDLLFDIPMQSPMQFRHGYTGMELNADAVDADGAPFSFGWVRNGKPPRVTSDPTRFAALRGGISPQQLERLFALDTELLRKGGTDLKGGMTLSAALLAGTGELAPAKSVHAAIEARRQQNWGPGKSKPPLNAAAKRLEEARKRMRDAIERPEKRGQDERIAAEHARALEDARAARDRAVAESRRLNRIELTRLHLLALDEAEAWLRDNSGAPALPAGLDTALAEARAALALATAKRDDTESARERAIQSAERIVRNTDYIRLADRMRALPGMLGEAEKTAKDIVERRAEYAARLDDVRSGLRAIGSGCPATRAEEVIPTVALMADVRAAITAEAGLRTALELADAAVAVTRTTLAKAETETKAAEPLPEGLTALLSEIRLDRNPVAHAEEVAAAARTATAEVRRTLASVPAWSGTAEALRALPLPPEAEFERLDAARAEAARGAEAARARRIAVDERDHAARVALAALQTRKLPDTASVLAARAERDRGMRLILRRAFGVPPSEVEEAAYTAIEPIPLAYERHVRTADELADRRAEQLKDVQDAERLCSEIEGGAEPRRQAASDEAEAIDKLAAKERDWAAATAPLGLAPRSTMADVRDTLSARVQLIEALAKAEVAAQAESALMVRHHAWAGRLASLMGDPAAPLEPLLARADQRVAAAQAAERSSTKRQAALESAARAVAEASEAQSKAGRALDAWRTGWVGLLQRLNRPLDESPVAVTAVLEGIAGIEKHHRDGTSLWRRIEAMQTDLDRFAATVGALAAAVGHPDAATPADTGRALIGRFTEASAADAAWKQARLAVDAAVAAAGDAGDALRDRHAELDAVVASCGGRTAEEAEARIAASRAHAEQTARRDGARAKLAEHGDGLAPSSLRLDAESVPAEEMLSRRDAAEDAAKAAQSKAEIAAAAFEMQQAALGQASAATDGLTAQVDFEAASAEFDRCLEEQLVLHVASTMLSDAMQAVEDGLGGSSLARASQAFGSVTGGAYGLESYDGPAGEELYAVERAYPGERKSLEKLSEGTRDQLYLALRLEALRDHCTAATALPFIADDILQTFDDDRARAALRALCDRSTQFQVIVLTHHLHIGAIASALPSRMVRQVALPP